MIRERSRWSKDGRSRTPLAKRILRHCGLWADRCARRIYGDCLPPPIPGSIPGIHRTNHPRTGHQREYRFLFAGFGKAASGFIDLELGPLHDIAELRMRP